MEGGSVMGFQVGDLVRVRLPKESLIWGSIVNGNIFKVRARRDRIYFLFDKFGFEYKEEWLELVKAAVRAPRAESGTCQRGQRPDKRSFHHKGSVQKDPFPRKEDRTHHHGSAEDVGGCRNAATRRG